MYISKGTDSLLFTAAITVYGVLRLYKLAFRDADTDTDTDTDILADFRARIVHEPDTHEDPRRLVRHAARFSSRGCTLGMRSCTRVLYKISYRIHVYKITR